MADRGYIDYSAPYFAEKERGRQQISQEAAYASAIAEQLGQYTPELQAQALRPLGYTPTVGESLIGAPIRGLGKLLGVESMQQVGAPRPFDIGQTQPQVAPTYPSLPEGTPPEMREALEGIAQQMGYTPQPEPITTPSIPSEVVGKPRLKTDKEWKAEQRYSDKVWDFIMQKYQTKEERKMAEAELANKIQETEYQNQLALESKARRERGVTPTEHTLMAQELESRNAEREEQGLSPVYYTDLVKKVAGFKKAKPAALLQVYELAVEQGYDGSIMSFKIDMERLKWDPLGMAQKIFFGSNSLLPFQVEREDWSKFMQDMAISYADAAEEIDREAKARGDKGFLDDTPIPEELVAQGVKEADIIKTMEETGGSRVQVIQMLMDYLNQVNRARNGSTVTAPTKPVGK